MNEWTNERIRKHNEWDTAYMEKCKKVELSRDFRPST